MNKSDIKQATYFDNPPSTILEDQPGRFYKEGAKYSVYWKAQSSIIINGKRSFTISWGFTIDSKNSGTYIRPNFVKEPTEFHKNAINYGEEFFMFYNDAFSNIELCSIGFE